MSIEEKQNSQTFQDSDFVEYSLNEKEVSNFIKKNYKANTPIEIAGSGSKKKIGKLIQCSKTLSLSKLNGIIEYLPEELYIKVKAGTPIKIIEEELIKAYNEVEREADDFFEKRVRERIEKIFAQANPKYLRGLLPKKPAVAWAELPVEIQREIQIMYDNCT